jgi:imidazolonepropionase-like amidohydrolase
MFGTDVGYMADYSTRDEFAALAKCGLSPLDILPMLTVAPAERLGVTAEKGTLQPGKLADFVVLGSDPAKEATAFADVRVTVRSGKLSGEQCTNSLSSEDSLPLSRIRQRLPA